MKIENIHSNHFTQALHLQYHTETRDLIKKFEPAIRKHIFNKLYKYENM